MHKYKFISKKGEGTFSEVIKAQTANNKYVAIKRMKNHFESMEQVNNLREVQALKRLAPHQGIIKLLEVIFERSTGRLSLVFELMDMNIFELIRGRRHFLPEKKVKFYMYQLLKAMDHIHRNGIFHRDIKPENILIAEDKLKIADFGSCRGVKSKQPFTEYISTRWYRAPECLLTDGYYNYKMDMWGVGCVFFEVMSLFPLFPGTNELDQIQKIHNILGSPPAELLAKMRRSTHMNFNFPQKEGTGIDRLIPNASADCVELIKKLLAYNPEERLSARQALRHPYFKELREAEKRSKLGAPLYTIVSSADTNGTGADNNTTNDAGKKKQQQQQQPPLPQPSHHPVEEIKNAKLPALTKKSISISKPDEQSTGPSVSHFGSTSTFSNTTTTSNRSSFELSDASPFKDKPPIGDPYTKKNPFVITALKPKLHELDLNADSKGDNASNHTLSNSTNSTHSHYTTTSSLHHNPHHPSASRSLSSLPAIAAKPTTIATTNTLPPTTLINAKEK